MISPTAYSNERNQAEVLLTRKEYVGRLAKILEERPQHNFKTMSAVLNQVGICLTDHVQPVAIGSRKSKPNPDFKISLIIFRDMYLGYVLVVFSRSVGPIDCY